MSRRALHAGRIVLWGAVALIWARGVISFIPGPTAAAKPEPAPVVKHSFPEQAAGAVAVRFAQDYLTYGRDGADERNRRLAAYLPEGADGAAGWDGRGKQEAQAAVPVGMSVLGPHSAVATVAVEAGERWFHVAVPLEVKKDRIVVSDLPAFLPGPWPAAAVAPRAVSADPARGGEIGPALESFFRAYAGGSPGDLSYFAAPGRTLTGLDGAVEFSGIPELRAGEGSSRLQAVARVRWTDKATGAGLTQTYRMQLVSRDGRWYVDRLGAGPAPSNAKEG